MLIYNQLTTYQQVYHSFLNLITLKELDTILLQLIQSRLNFILLFQKQDIEPTQNHRSSIYNHCSKEHLMALDLYGLVLHYANISKLCIFDILWICCEYPEVFSHWINRKIPDYIMEISFHEFENQINIFVVLSSEDIVQFNHISMIHLM